MRNKLGSDTCDAKLTIRKIYCAPTFAKKFGDLQQVFISFNKIKINYFSFLNFFQLPTFDAKFPAKITGVPQPVAAWTKDGESLNESLKYHIKHDGDSHCLYIRDLVPEDSGIYKCHAHNKEGEASCEARLEVVTKM